MESRPDAQHCTLTGKTLFGNPILLSCPCPAFPDPLP